MSNYLKRTPFNHFDSNVLTWFSLALLLNFLSYDTHNLHLSLLLGRTMRGETFKYHQRAPITNHSTSIILCPPLHLPFYLLQGKTPTVLYYFAWLRTAGGNVFLHFAKYFFYALTLLFLWYWCIPSHSLHPLEVTTWHMEYLEKNGGRLGVWLCAEGG